MLKLILTVFLLAPLITGEIFGQETKRLPEEYFYNTANGQNFALSTKQLKEIPFRQVLLSAGPFLNDPDPRKRFRAIDVIKRAGAMSDNVDERRTAVVMLTSACKDEDSGNSGVASSGLQLFTREEFTQQAADSIAALLEKHGYHFERIIRIAGFIDNASTTKVLEKLQETDSTLSGPENWAVELALARTGNSESISYCTELIGRAPVNDYSVSYLFPDLVYMRQPESVRIVLQEIMSDELKCKSSNPDKEAEITCAFKLIELIAPIIEDFPVKLTSYGELDSENYDDTLLIVRQWIRQNDTYHLIMNIY